MEKHQPLIPNLIDTYDWRSVTIETANDIEQAFEYARNRASFLNDVDPTCLMRTHHILSGMVTLHFNWERWHKRWAFSMTLPKGEVVEEWTSSRDYDALLTYCQGVIQNSLSNA